MTAKEKIQKIIDLAVNSENHKTTSLALMQLLELKTGQDTIRKTVGFLNRIANNEKIETDDLTLTRQELDKDGNVFKEVYGLRNNLDVDTTGMRVKKVSKTPYGGAYVTYENGTSDQEHYEQLKQILIKDIEENAPKAIKYNYKNPFKESYEKGVVVELMITDFHLGKISMNFDDNTNEWNLNACKELFLSVIQSVKDELKDVEINHFILPTGNDYLNIDNSSNTTTKGTPQMTANFWKHLYRFGKNLLTFAIDELIKTAPVKVIMVEGNHDTDSVFSLGENLTSHYRNFDNVEIDNSYERRKYHTFGNVLLGFFHFNEAKPNKAHNSIISDVQHLAHKKFKAIHGGHYHKNTKTAVKDHILKDESYGIEIEICPSLCPTDEWHYKNLYVGNLRRSKTFVWCPENGLIKELYYNL